MRVLPKSLSRREFLKGALWGLSSFVLSPWLRLLLAPKLALKNNFPTAEKLGRVLDYRVPIKAKPDMESATVGELYIDQVVVWLRETTGSRKMWFSQRFVETPQGYVYASHLQPVRNQLNQPVHAIPNGEDGFWVEVSVPYTDVILDNPPPRSPWLKSTLHPRLYYSQVLWVNAVRIDESSRVWYRVGDRYGSFGDWFWVPGENMRIIREEETAPIHPEVEDKTVEVDVTLQTLSCKERGKEIFFCRVSTGPKVVPPGGNKKEWATPLGKHTIWRKLVSVHMTGGTTGGGYDLPGIGWTTLFSGKGMAIHATYWHNSFGIPASHGCVNLTPEDALWVFRWTAPVVPFARGDITVSGEGGTRVWVIES